MSGVISTMWSLSEVRTIVLITRVVLRTMPTLITLSPVTIRVSATVAVVIIIITIAVVIVILATREFILIILMITYGRCTEKVTTIVSLE